MQTVGFILQITLSLILLNVWLVRFNQRTAYRGGNASSMRAEFAAYKLPAWSLYAVGALKVGAALCLLAGLWFHAVVVPAALVICLLMLGALAMHLKVRDPFKKFLPALFVLGLSVSTGIVSVWGGL